MEQLLRCKVCGYILRSNQMKDKCPACGVGKSAFEEYVEKTSPKRIQLLQLDLHPILVHFPQSFSTFLLLLIGFISIDKNFLYYEILDTIEILIYTLPAFVLIAFLAGMFDGKLRFKRITTPLLKRKIVFGACFIGFSLGMIFSYSLISYIIVRLIVLFLLDLGCVLCATFLGKIGVGLICAKMPN
jgi:rubredoxin